MRLYTVRHIQVLHWNRTESLIIRHAIQERYEDETMPVIVSYVHISGIP